MTKLAIAIVWLLALASIGYSMKLVSDAASGAFDPVLGALRGESQ